MSESKNKIKLFEERQVRTIWDKGNEKLAMNGLTK
jgi:hypothetical protein